MLIDVIMNISKWLMNNSILWGWKIYKWFTDAQSHRANFHAQFLLIRMVVCEMSHFNCCDLFRSVCLTCWGCCVTGYASAKYNIWTDFVLGLWWYGFYLTVVKKQRVPAGWRFTMTAQIITLRYWTLLKDSVIAVAVLFKEFFKEWGSV